MKQLILMMAFCQKGSRPLEVNVKQNIRGKNVMVGDDNTLIDTQGSAPKYDEIDFPSLSPTKEDGEGNQRNIQSAVTVFHDTQNNTSDVCTETGSQQKMGAIPKRSFAQVTQHIQAKEIVNVININQSGEETVPKLSNIESEMKKFLNAVKDFKYGHLILVADNMEPNVNIQSLGLVPWTFIFDFDPKSRSSGLLSQAETVIKGKRSLHINTWQDKCSITDQSCHWMFLKGTKEQPDSKTKEEFSNWKKQTRTGLQHITEQLQKFGESYTEYYVVIFWPANENMSLHVKHLVSKLEETDLCKFVIVSDNQGNSGCESNSDLQSLLRELSDENQPTIIRLGVDDICTAINRHFVNGVSDKSTKYSLPTHDSAELTIINGHHVQWLREGLEVLYETSPYEYEGSLDELQKQSDEFFRGGNWPWHMWYETDAGYVDVTRDIMKDILESLRKKHIDVYRSGRVTLCHMPGSGGTTLAQRIMWELRTVTPCAQVKLRTPSSDVASRAEFLYDRTRRPILLLLDGEDEQRVELLMRDLREICCVVLYVKRYPYPMEKKHNSENRFWLKGFVSKQEARKIADKYLRLCDTESKQKLVRKIEKEVAMGKTDHAIFEFGLAVYRHEYKGIESYVKGFLQLEDMFDGEMLPWQQALAILSLVYFYGQTAMPCKFFSEMLEIDHLLHPDDFPDEMKALIVRDTNDGRINVVRISHYLVAKEVLEQVLSGPIPRGVRCEELCDTAKRKLEPFAVSFIRHAGRKASEQPSNMMVKIMTRTFICRDNKTAGETDVIDTNRRRRFKFAQIVLDVSARAPFTERFHIFEELTRSFPQEAQFQAHLGRLFSLCRPEEEASAEKCFKKAIEICEDEIGDLPIEDIPHTTRLTLMHIYHMYGSMFLARVSKYTGKHLGQRPKRTVSNEKIEQTTRILFEMVKMTCEYFTKCRNVTPVGLEDDLGFIGEITIRLMFCDFVYRRNSKGDIYDFINKYEDDEIAGFVEDCISAIDGLILECLSIVDPDKIEKELLNLQPWFASLFRIDRPGRVICRTKDNLKSRRIQIAARKLMYEKKKIFGVLEEVTNKSDIEFIVKEYEKNFVDIHDNGVESSRQAIDLDYREWIFAIRHKLFGFDYAVEDVLQKVRLWHEKVKTPNSRLYLFILCSLMGFGTNEIPKNTQLLIEAKQLKEELLKQSKKVVKPKHPREWLGTGLGIRRLTPERRFFGFIDGRTIKGTFAKQALDTRVGTILEPNDKPASGYISLDLGEDNLISVNVFYVPALTEMKGQAFAGTRVTFFLGFSMAHGYEAYQVEPVKTTKCKKCGRYVELQNSLTKCKCGEIIKAE